MPIMTSHATGNREQVTGGRIGRVSPHRLLPCLLSPVIIKQSSVKGASMQSVVRSVKLSSLSIFLALAVSLLPGAGGAALWRAQASAQSTPPAVQGRTMPLPVSRSRAFINYRNSGSVGCREATEAEARMLKNRADPSLHIISSASSVSSTRTQNLSAESTGLQIILRATNQLENYPKAKAAFLSAAARWQSLISTPITVIIDVDFGPTWFGEKYDTDVLGQTDSQDLGDASIYTEVRSALTGLGANNNRADIYNQLPLYTVPTDIGNTSYVEAPSAVWRSLGFISATADPASEKNTLGDPPAVGFNSDFSYDFNPDDGVDSNKIDFDSVAVHEIGHVLGFTSDTGYHELDRTFPVSVAIWDLFRFRPGASFNTFAASERVLSSGGSQTYFDGTVQAALSTGRPDGTGGDRQQASHWKDDRLTGQYIGVMDPTLSDGKRYEISANDIAALKSFGYIVGADQVAADLPTIKNVSFNGTKLKIVGKRFIGQLEVEINGLVVTPQSAMTVNSAGKKIKIKADQGSLNLRSGSNQVVVISNGVSSGTFTFTL